MYIHICTCIHIYIHHTATHTAQTATHTAQTATHAANRLPSNTDVTAHIKGPYAMHLSKYKQHTAPHTATHRNTTSDSVPCANTLQHTLTKSATHKTVRQTQAKNTQDEYGAKGRMRRISANTLQHALQHVATRCNIHCYAPQHVAGPR